MKKRILIILAILIPTIIATCSIYYSWNNLVYEYKLVRYNSQDIAAIKTRTMFAVALPALCTQPAILSYKNNEKDKYVESVYAVAGRVKNIIDRDYIARANMTGSDLEKLSELVAPRSYLYLHDFITAFEKPSVS